MITIRPEQPADLAPVREINAIAFGQPTEASIVDSLRDACPDAVSLVAVEGDKILGHIFFSPVSVTRGQAVTQGMGLAPMAVLPERQRRGIGSMLVRAGIDVMRERNCPFIMVLGHPEYYPHLATGHPSETSRADGESRWPKHQGKSVAQTGGEPSNTPMKSDGRLRRLQIIGQTLA